LLSNTLSFLRGAQKWAPLFLLFFGFKVSDGNRTFSMGKMGNKMGNKVKIMLFIAYFDNSENLSQTAKTVGFRLILANHSKFMNIPVTCLL
jgi:hypothetical protein